MNQLQPDGSSVRLLSVAIVDDAAEIRMLFRAELAKSADFVVCAEGGTGLEAVEIARQFRPDVMLLDNSMPEMDGIDALPLVLTASPETAVVILSGVLDPRTVAIAAERGAKGCLEKRLRAGPLPERLLGVLQSQATTQDLTLNLAHRTSEDP